MVIESEVEKSDDSKIELYVNTANFTNEDFRTYLNLCDRIQYNEEMRRQHRLPKATMTATMTRKELFECSTLDEDGFLRALEHQNSYVPPPLQDDDFSRSMTEVMHYFDEDVVVDSGSSIAESPVKQHSTVATVLVNLQKNKGSRNSTPSPTIKRRNWQPKMEISSKIQELKKQYESDQAGMCRSPKKSKSPKALRKSMVKQLARIFNSKASETPSEANQQKSLKQRPMKATYRPQMLPSPVHSPHSRRKQSTKIGNFILNGDKLSKQQELKLSNSRRKFARGEVINEKQESVKQLTKKLEANSVMLQQHNAKPPKHKVTTSNKESKLVTMNVIPRGINNNNERVLSDHGTVIENVHPTEDSASSKSTVINETSIGESTSISTAVVSKSTNLRVDQTKEVIDQPYELHSSSKVDIDKRHSADSHEAKPINIPRIETPKPKRKKKKKMRRMLLWQPDLCMVEAKPIPSTDSESEYNTAVNNSPVKIQNYAKYLSDNIDQNYKPIFHALDESLRLSMCSPLQAGASHSLSIVFSEQLISGVFGSTIFETTQRNLSRSCPSLIEVSVHVGVLGVKAMVKSTLLEKSVPAIEPSMQLDTELKLHQVVPLIEQPIQSAIQHETLNHNVSHKLIDSYIDHCFEAAIKDHNATLDIAKTDELQKFGQTEESLSKILAAEITVSSKSNEKYPSGFSTPVKGHLEPGSDDDLLEKLDLSPILATPSQSANGTPVKCSSESIAPDSANQNKETIAQVQLPATPQNKTMMQNSFNQGIMEKASSVFWINTGDFCVSLDIYHNSDERLSLLYDIFTQKSYESHAINFGIDDQLYFAADSMAWSNMRDHFPRVANCSHYWFASGDMTLPFMGKFMPPEKIQRLFTLVKVAVAESGTLHFGIDRFDFSSVPEAFHGKTFIHSSIPRATPNVMSSSSTYSNSIRTSDLDHTSFDSEASGDFALSTTPLSDNYSGSISIDSAHFTLPQQDIMGSECHSLEYEEDQSVAHILKESTDQKCNTETSVKWISKPLNALQSQQQKLKSVEQRIHRYANSIDLTPLSNQLEPFKDSPYYVSELQEIIAAIIDIGQVAGFKNCSLHQLESFTYFLSHYADICLESCLEHMDRILEALKEKRAVKV